MTLKAIDENYIDKSKKQTNKINNVAGHLYSKLARNFQFYFARSSLDFFVAEYLSAGLLVCF